MVMHDYVFLRQMENEIMAEGLKLEHEFERQVEELAKIDKK
jgi:hypothetical protein